MKKWLAILCAILLASCTFSENVFHEVNTDVETTPFKKLPYDVRNIYSDSISKRITPNKSYKYWAYVAYRQSWSSNLFEIVKEGGDTLMRTRVDSLPATLGFFHRGHPNFRSNFAVAIENDSLKYIGTATGFREFIGTIDNLGEAVLVATSFEYYLDDGAAYRIVNGNYEIKMRKVYEHLSRPYLNIVSVTKDGFVKITAVENVTTKKS